jgi:hypothetical protein
LTPVTARLKWHHNQSHTVEFSRNRRPNHPHQGFHLDRLRPGVVRSFSCFSVSHFRVSRRASELIRPFNASQFLAFRVTTLRLSLPALLDLSRSFPRFPLWPGCSLSGLLFRRIPIACSRPYQIFHTLRFTGTAEPRGHQPAEHVPGEVPNSTPAWPRR